MSDSFTANSSRWEQEVGLVVPLTITAQTHCLQLLDLPIAPHYAKQLLSLHHSIGYCVTIDQLIKRQLQVTQLPAIR